MKEGYTSVELTTTVPGVGYTLKHRTAVESLISYYCRKAIGKRDGNGQVFTKQDYIIMCNRGKCHDMDKVLMSLSYPQLTADYFHRIFNGHHEESMVEPNLKSKYDWMEMLFDMESAKYTKPDKAGGGAFAFASVYKENIMPYLMPYFVLFELNKKDTGIVEEIKQKANKRYFESDLIEAILNYIHTTRIHLLDGLSRIDDKGYMALYDKPVPFRHPSTQSPKTLYHQRPNAVVGQSKSISAREMIHGTLEAEMFDFDRLCLLSADQVKALNKQGLNIVKDMGLHQMQR